MNKTRLAGFVTAVAGAMVLTTAALLADNTLKLTVNSQQYNPCNGETVTGQVDVLLKVSANQAGETPHVSVHRSFHGTLTGTLGNEYKISSMANAQFDVQASYYDLTFENNVIGVGKVPNFIQKGVLRVFVNANQEPIGYQASGTQFECK